MKYETVIRVVCEAFDEDDAYNTAGEYLRGNIDGGITMTCRTHRLKSLRVKNYAAGNIKLLILISSLLLVVSAVI
ncbi:MAG: hypothetical protein ABH883_05585 [Candidatus Omnitrophota bacterium]